MREGKWWGVAGGWGRGSAVIEASSLKPLSSSSLVPTDHTNTGPYYRVGDPLTLPPPPSITLHPPCPPGSLRQAMMSHTRSSNHIPMSTDLATVVGKATVAQLCAVNVMTGDSRLTDWHTTDGRTEKEREGKMEREKKR